MIEKLFDIRPSMGPFANCVDVKFSELIPKDVAEMALMDLLLELKTCKTKMESLIKAESFLADRLDGADKPGFAYISKFNLPSKEELGRAGLRSKRGIIVRDGE
jgi:hypothetical protein